MDQYNWTSVDDFLPDVGQDWPSKLVVVLTVRGWFALATLQTVDRFSEKSRIAWVSSSTEKIISDVTHWVELPRKPDE